MIKRMHPPLRHAGFAAVAITQLYDPAGPFMTGYLNAQLTLAGPLAAPVRGLLASSYNAALARPRAAAADGLAFTATVVGGKPIA